MTQKDFRALWNPAVIVAALGYFVDIYDLLLFNIVRIPSLREIGLAGQELEKGAILHNLQMSGMMVGGILWGVLGDKKGRLSVLFGSIILYSVANLANAFVQDFTQYAVLRFAAGVGLAGELGAGITLVAETLPKHLRGYGTMIVATIGVSGAVVAGLVGERFDWRTCYTIGGSLGLVLLVLRIGVYESGLYSTLKKEKSISRGDFFRFFKEKALFNRYIRCILIGIPVWTVIGILIAYAPEFSKALGVKASLADPITAAKSVMYCYAGLVFGDFLSGTLSQFLASRKKAALLFISITALSALAYLLQRGTSPGFFYSLCFTLGFGTGYWAVLVTIAVEQFGTNLRATAGTSVPNFVRGSVVPMSLFFLGLKPVLGILGAAGVVMGISVGLSLFAIFGLKETFGTDLNYTE